MTGRTSHPPEQTRAEIERLMGHMREANERLIVSALRTQSLSDDADVEAVRARRDLDELMLRLRAANEELATMVEEARAREERYRRLSVRLLTLQDEERRRLALDLHDSTGQGLAALTMNLDVVGRAAQALDAPSRRALAESRSLADQCAREVRTMAYLLHPPLLDEVGLLSAVRWYAEGVAKRSGIHITMDLGEIARLPGQVETTLFRVVQEALTNIHRHASATTASIRLTADAHAVALDIHDEGHGLRDPVSRDNTLPETLGVGDAGACASAGWDLRRRLHGHGHDGSGAGAHRQGHGMKPVRILIADDHDVVRRGVRAVLEGQAGWVVCGEASTGRDAVVKAIDLQPDVVVLDITMPELNGLEATRQIRRAVSAKVLILTVHESDQVVREVLDAGAHGYVLKTDAGKALVDAISALLRNQEFFSEGVYVIAARVAGARDVDGVAPAPAPRRLTPREREVLQLLAEGKSNKEVGVLLGVTTKTAETHRAHVMAKLDIHSMSELVRYAIKNGIIEP